MSSVRKNSAISGRKRRSARDGDAQAPAELVLHLRVDELVRDPVLARQARGSGSSRSLYGIASRPTFSAQSIRRRRKPDGRVELSLDARVHLLVQRAARSAGPSAAPSAARRQSRRGRRGTRSCSPRTHRAGRGGDRSCARAGGTGAAGPGRGELLERVDRRRHLVVVAVADHAGLRRAGRPGRVDEGEEVVLADLALRLGERVRVLLAVARGRAPRARRALQREHVRERGDAIRRAARRGRRRSPRRGRACRPQSPARARRVDRRGDCADPGECEVDEHPFEPRRGHDPEHVAFLDPQREQPERDLLDAARGLLPRDLAPAVLLLGQVGGCGPVLRPLPSARGRGSFGSCENLRGREGLV